MFSHYLDKQILENRKVFLKTVNKQGLFVHFFTLHCLWGCTCMLKFVWAAMAGSYVNWVVFKCSNWANLEGQRGFEAEITTACGIVNRHSWFIILKWLCCVCHFFNDFGAWIFRVLWSCFSLLLLGTIPISLRLCITLKTVGSYFVGRRLLF